MERDPFKLFIDLVTFDQEILKSNKEIEVLKNNLSLLESEAIRLDTQLQVQKNILTDATKDVHDIELRIKDLDEKERDKKKKLEEVASTKEFTLLKKELERVQQAQLELEPELVKAWNKLENTKKDFEIKSKEIEQKIADAQVQLKEKRDTLSETQNKIETLYKERPQKEQDVPVEWLEKYNIMHTKVANPVVEVINNSCSACFYSMTNQDIINLNKKQLIQCKGCFRLLYLKDIK